MPNLLLSTKLFIPSLRVEHVSRPRLVAQLNACLSHQLTLVSAPAGYGKTTLLSEWAKTCGFPVAWLTIDEGDDDPERLLEYVSAAFQTAGISETSQQASSSGLQDRLARLINLLSAVSGPIILILDDYHLLSSLAAHNCLGFILEHQPDHLHIILASRADPPLSLARLRGRGQLSEIRLADLRFTEDEAVRLIRQIDGCKLSPEDTRSLTARTEGWAAGLQMAAAALRTLQQTGDSYEVSRFIQEFSGSHRYILDYLMEEVLANISDAVRSFLYQTSILKTFTANLCAEVMGTEWITPAGATERTLAITPGQCQSILEQIEQANLFIIPLDPNRQWYRYHQLFSDILQKRLLELTPERIPALYLRASRWFERQDLAGPAIEYALLAKNYRYAAGLLESNAENMLMRGELINFSRWTKALPEDELHANPLLTAYFGLTLLFDGESEELVEKHLIKAEKNPLNPTAAAAVLSLRSFLMVIRGEYRAGDNLAKQALRVLPPDCVFLRNYLRGSLAFAELWSGNNLEAIRKLEDALEAGKKAGNLVFTPLVMRRLGRIYIAMGQLQKGSQYLEEALKIAVNSRGEPLPHVGMILISRGRLKHEWNDLDSAELDIRSGIELLNQWGKVRIADAYVSLAETIQARGDFQAARDVMEQAVEKARLTQEYEVDDLQVAYARARLAVRQGDLATALKWANAAGMEDDPGPAARLSGNQPLPNPLLNYLRREEYLVLGRLRLAQGQPEQALRILNELLVIFEHDGWTSLILETELIRALAFDALGKRQEGFASLHRALDLGRAGGYTRIFLDEGVSLHALLQVYHRGAREEAEDIKAYLQRLIDAFSGHPIGPSTGSQVFRSETANNPKNNRTLDPLSKRELEVLRQLATYLTVPDIARELGVSTSTVRTHIKHIYEKLDVHTRIEAVERTKQIKLF